MAIATAITRDRATEDASFYHPTLISALFSIALGVFAVLIEHERDIAEVDIWDPAFRDWLSAAEHAQDELSDLQRLLMAAPITRPTDRPLQLAAFLLQSTLGSESPEELARLRGLAREKASYFLLDDSTATNRRVNQMLKRALALYEDYLDLDLVGRVAEDPLEPGL